MQKFIKLFTLLTLCSLFSLQAETYPLNQIKNFADGLNIEGGTIASTYLKPHQLWANLCVVLDRPFEDGVEWQELTDANSYPLKEASIIDYNECQVNLAYASILDYYIQNGHELSNKSKDEPVNILIQVHRNTSGPAQLNALADLLVVGEGALDGIKQPPIHESKYELFSYFFPNECVNVSFCYGTVPANLGKMHRYDTVDIVISLSLVAGFNPEWPSGSLLVPDQFIPYTLKDSCVHLDQQYAVRNHLKEALKAILENQDQKRLDRINQYFQSPNPEKSFYTAKMLTREHFKQATLVQVDGMFNPSKLPLSIDVKNAL